jgi:hypothetical protein
MAGARATRRQRGIAQNFANQLAQMAVGWHIMFNGPSLIGEPDTGVMEFDAVHASSSVNGKTRDTPMASYLAKWVIDEIKRLQLDTSWLTEAMVEVRYRRTITDDRADRTDLTAVARIACGYGAVSSTFSNHQPMLRKL